MRPTALLCSALCAVGLPAQQLLWERTGAGLQTLGRSSSSNGIVANLGDLDGDGCEDLIVLGAELTTIGSQLWILSGKDGSTIRTVPHTSVSSEFVIIGGTGDMDPPASGPGTSDYMVLIQDRTTSKLPNRLEVRSGVDDTVLWAVERPWREGFGRSLLGNVDLDGDGLPDVVATSPFYWAGARVGAVFAYRNDGSPLWQVLGTPQLYVGAAPAGDSLGLLGDIDQDGIDDLVVGGVDHAAGAYGGIVLSGRTGQVLVKGLGPPGYQMGESCDGVGDIDQDGVPDFAVGSYYGNLVMAFSGRTGQELYRWQAATLGVSVKGGGTDLDLDGVPDVLAGAPSELGAFGPRGSVFAYSGRDGSQVLRVDRPVPTSGGRSNFGAVLEVLRPQPGNPFPLFAISDPEHGSYLGSYLGRIAVYRGAPPSAQPFGQACAGARPAPPLLGMKPLGTLGAQGARFHLSGAEPGAAAAFALGVSSTTWAGRALPLALDPFGFPGCSLYTSIELAIPVVTGSQGIGAGYASFDLPVTLRLPTWPAHWGLKVTLHGQWLVLGTEPNATAALAWKH